jgi:hypothetical protein
MMSYLKRDVGSFNPLNREWWTEVRATHITALVCCACLVIWLFSSKTCISLEVSTAVNTEHQYHLLALL